jgi:hypothetical protein
MADGRERDRRRGAGTRRVSTRAEHWGRCSDLLPWRSSRSAALLASQLSLQQIWLMFAPGVGMGCHGAMHPIGNLLGTRMANEFVAYSQLGPMKGTWIRSFTIATLRCAGCHSARLAFDRGHWSAGANTPAIWRAWPRAMFAGTLANS